MMTPILAEIFDKMPTPIECWGSMLVLSLPALTGFVDQRVAWVMLVVALLFSVVYGYGMYHQAFLEAQFSDAVQSEMGQVWIAHSIASAFLPAVVAFVVLGWHMRNRARPQQAGDAPNGGPATPVGNSGVPMGPQR